MTGSGREIPAAGGAASRAGEPPEDEDVLERFSLAASQERWVSFLGFAHATLPAPIDYEREEDAFLVRRRRPPGRPVRDGRIPRAHAPALFLQAAGALAALSAAGTWAGDDDWLTASWDVRAGAARLWLGRTPSGVDRGGPSPPASEALRALVERLFGRRGRVRDPEALELLDRLRGADAAWRRPEFWIATGYRLFPELATERGSRARARTAGSLVPVLWEAAERARVEKGRALLEGRGVRIFSTRSKRGVPDRGAALGLGPSGGICAESAIRALREEYAGAGFSQGVSQGVSQGASRGLARRTTWICVEMDGWDSVSREAVEEAAVSLRDRVELVRVAERVASPASPEAWRAALFVPCGSAAASLRFYERLASLPPGKAELAAARMVDHPAWAAFASDPTGDAPFPPVRSEAAEQEIGRLSPRDLRVLQAVAVLEEPPEPAELRIFFSQGVDRIVERLARRGALILDPQGRPSAAPAAAAEVSPGTRASLLCRWAEVAGSPGRRVSLFLAAGNPARALQAAEEWRRGDPDASPRRWFEVSARLAAAIARPRPAWIEAVEAERELAGGRSADAEERLRWLGSARIASFEERREASLRRAEIVAMRGRAREAADAAALWRRENRDSTPGQTVRSLRLEAAALSRVGQSERALALLDEAQRAGESLPAGERVDTALCKAAALARAGRHDEEAAVYARERRLVAALGDERSAARLLASEALGLSDRREFPAAIGRLEEALEILRNDPVERAKISIDLAATLHHAGRGERCASLLEEAAALASSVGRHDLARVAAGNLIQSALDSGDAESASRRTAALLESARAEADPVWTLVALHHRGRLALRAGRLEDAARDNREARELAATIGDPLEVGELWLEDGDRAALSGDLAGARRSWEVAAADPPDRCDTAGRARNRVAEMDALERGEADARLELAAEEFRRGAADAAVAVTAADAADAVARWARLFPERVPDSLVRAARDLLVARGSGELARIAFGDAPAGGAAARQGGELRRLREAVAAALGGDPRAGEAGLPLGISHLSVSAPGGAELFRLGAAHGEAQEAVRKTLHAGAAEYELRMTPVPREETVDAVALLIETLLYRPSASESRAEFAAGWSGLGVVAADGSMEEPYRRLLRFAPRPITVLVLGESGSGKEAVARAVHTLSPRAAGRFVPVNVSAIPGALLESELFGHARGAFTGADRDRAGLFEEAAGGTIFFDEVGDLAAPLQAKLLRVLQDREIRRVGENRARRVDVRVVSATSRELAREVDEGRFREDLFYRLNVAVIALPPLRQRGRDALVLARHFLAQCGRDERRPPLDLVPETTALLLAHSWPGNVRELQSAIFSAAALADGSRVEPCHLPDSVRRAARRPLERGKGYRSNVNAHRRDLIMEALDRAGGNRTRAARELNLSRQALLYLIRELKVTEPGRGPRRGV